MANAAPTIGATIPPPTLWEMFQNAPTRPRSRRGNQFAIVIPRFYVSTSKSIIKALINMHSFEFSFHPLGERKVLKNMLNYQLL
ncbi:hypothetical protein EAN97_22980 [Klebsiella pneumoniae]|nr:hypothetical protein EAN97_22980 [Klebsiella pneumoniae]